MDGQQWLAACHPSPRQAHQQWKKPPHLAAFACGLYFDAARLSQQLALNVLWELGDQAQKIPVLEYHRPPRPVFYFLVEPGTTLPPAAPVDAAVLKTGDEFSAPSPSADALTGVQLHSRLWRTPPDGSGHIGASDVFESAVVRACDKERQEARVRAARTVFWGAVHKRWSRP